MFWTFKYMDKKPFSGDIACAKILFDNKCDLAVLKKEITKTDKMKLQSFKVSVKY